MEARLIVAVCEFPELYDPYSPFYKNRKRSDLIWRKISTDIGVPDEICKKRWKTLRDTYVRQRRKEKETKKSGAEGGKVPKWKYLSILSFLEPFIAPRETLSNIWVEEEQAEGSEHPEEPEEALGHSEIEVKLEPCSLAEPESPSSSANGQPGPSSAPAPAVKLEPCSLAEPESPSSSANGQPGPSSAPAPEVKLEPCFLAEPESPSSSANGQPGPSSAPAPAGPPRKRLRRRQLDWSEPSYFERELLEALKSLPGAAPAVPNLDEDMHFLLSLHPLLKRVPPMERDILKFQIHKMIFESANMTLNLADLDNSQ